MSALKRVIGTCKDQPPLSTWALAFLPILLSCFSLQGGEIRTWEENRLLRPDNLKLRSLASRCCGSSLNLN